MMIILKVMVKLKKLLELQQKNISLNHIYQIMILDLHLSGLMILVIIFTFFYIRYQKFSKASQPIKVEFKFDGVVSYHINGYSSVLTYKMVSASSDGQRHSDLI